MGDPRFTELARVPVRVGPQRDDGALAPVFSDGRLMLTARTPEGTSSPIGVNIDSLVLLDALQDGTVFEVEVLLPPDTWLSRPSPLTPPSATEVGSVAITDPGPSIFVEQLSPRCTTDRHGRLHIELEPPEDDARWVALSPQCFAVLNGGFLASLVAMLPSGG